MNKQSMIKSAFINNRKWQVECLLLFFVCLGFSATRAQMANPCQLQSFGTITISPDFELDGSGENIDTIEFWEAPDLSNTLMFVTAKDNSLVEVWKYPFVKNEQTSLTHSTFLNSQVNGVVIDQEMDRIYVAIGKSSSTVSVFQLPEMKFIMNFNKPGVNLEKEPNITLLKLSNGEKRVYLSSSQDVYIHDAVTGDLIGEFRPDKGLETMAGDDFYQVIYIPDENDRTGIYAYHPDGTPFEKNGTNNFGGNGIFDADAEGIWIYSCPTNGIGDDGSGFIVVSDQIKSGTEFEFFDRKTWKHLGAIKIDGVGNTDGICSFQRPLPDYPMGLFAAINNDGTTVGVGWDVIFSAIGVTTGIENGGDTPKTFFVGSNYPNPFNPSTTINYRVPHHGQIQLNIFNLLGQKVRSLINKQAGPGNYWIVWDGKNDAGGNEASGAYFYSFIAAGFSQTNKMLLIR